MKTILIAEDEEDLRDLLVMTLENPAYQIIEASDGESALQILHTLLPDVVILDWMMPKKNGIEVARIIRQVPRLQHIPIIMLTAKGQPGDLDQGREVGVYAYFVKPFSPLQLLDTVHEVLEKAGAPSSG